MGPSWGLLPKRASKRGFVDRYKCCFLLSDIDISFLHQQELLDIVQRD